MILVSSQGARAFLRPTRLEPGGGGGHVSIANLQDIPIYCVAISVLSCKISGRFCVVSHVSVKRPLFPISSPCLSFVNVESSTAILSAQHAW